MPLITLPNNPIIARNSTQSIVFTTYSSAIIIIPYKRAPPMHIKSPKEQTQISLHFGEHV